MNGKNRKKALNSSIRRDIRGSFSRFFAIFAIIALGVGFFSGVRITTPAMVHTMDLFFREKNLYDYRLISTLGWEEQDVEKVRQEPLVLSAEGSIQYDIICLSAEGSDTVYKAHLLPEDLNQLVIREGRLPEEKTEVVLDSKNRAGLKLGDTLRFSPSNTEDDRDHFTGTEYTVVGFADSSLYVNFERGTTSLGTGSVSGFLYLTREAFADEIYTEIYVDMDIDGEIYSEEYDSRMDMLREGWEDTVDRIARGRYDRLRSEAEDKLTDARQELEEEKEKNGKKLEDAGQELADAAKELEDAREEIRKGEEELAEGKQSLDESLEKLEDAERVLDRSGKELVSARQELDRTRDRLDEGKEKLDETLAVLTAAKAELDGGKETLDATGEQLDTAEESLKVSGEQLAGAKTLLDRKKEELEAAKAVLPADRYAVAEAAYKQGLAEYETNYAEYEKGLAEYEAGREAYQKGLEEYEKSLAEYEAGYAEYEKGLITWEAGFVQYEAGEKKYKEGLQAYRSGYRDYISGREQYKEGLAEYEEAAEKLEEGKKEYEEGLAEYEEGLAEYEDGRKEYEEKISEAEEKIADGEKELADFKAPDTFLMERNTNIGFACFENDSEIVEQVAKVFPIFFILVAALVCMTTMTRMVEENRGQIGVLKALGYSNGDIIRKFATYSGTAAMLGCIFGYAVGIFLFPAVIWNTYHLMYIHLNLAFIFDLKLALVAVLVSLLCSVGITLLSCRYELGESAAQLMRPKAPKPGKRVFLENVPFIWNRLKFLHKVSVRNILRYKGRFLMMIVGIGGSTSLLLTGFGMKDSIAGFAQMQFEQIQTADVGLSFRQDEESLREIKTRLDRDAEDYVLSHADTWDLLSGKKVKSVNLIVPEAGGDFQKFFHLATMDGESLQLPGRGELLVSIAVAQRNGLKVGDVVKLRNSALEEIELRISGIFRSHIYNYVIASPEDIRDQVNTAYVIFPEGTDVYKAQASIAECEGISYVTIYKDLEERMSKMMSSLDYIVLVVVLSAAGLAFVVLYNLTNINITERIREIATIKVLGFYSNETAQYVFRENYILTFFGMVVGLGLGILLHRYVMTQIVVDMVYFNKEIKPISFGYGAVLTFLFTFLVSLMMRRKLEKINMAESLKSVE